MSLYRLVRGKYHLVYETTLGRHQGLTPDGDPAWFAPQDLTKHQGFKRQPEPNRGGFFHHRFGETVCAPVTTTAMREAGNHLREGDVLMAGFGAAPASTAQPGRTLTSLVESSLGVTGERWRWGTSPIQRAL